MLYFLTTGVNRKKQQHYYVFPGIGFVATKTEAETIQYRSRARIAEAKFVGFQRIALLCGRLLQHSCVFRPMSGSFIFVLIITFFYFLFFFYLPFRCVCFRFSLFAKPLFLIFFLVMILFCNS